MNKNNKSIFDRLSDAASDAIASVTSLVKVILLSRHAAPAGSLRDRPLAILANGPSLAKTLEEMPEWLMASDKLAVNFAANTSQFCELHPEWYVLADGHFFCGRSSDPNVELLWSRLESVDWPMTLFVPLKYYADGASLARINPNVSVKGFNLTPAEGWTFVTHPLFSRGLAMPRPRNVLIPSIMLGIREGYRTIYLAGADHSWSRSLWVDDQNRVVSVQPHFYKDNSKELDRVAQEYAGYHLHDILHSLTVAFRSYHQIADFARKQNISIINKTPGSFIDAFPRE